MCGLRPNLFFFCTSNALYAFPFPTAYHGSPTACPARTRRRGYSRYLWSHVVGYHGTAVPLRHALAVECDASKGCLGWDATAEQDNKLAKGVPKRRGVTHRFNDSKLVELLRLSVEENALRRVSKCNSRNGGKMRSKCTRWMKIQDAQNV